MDLRDEKKHVQLVGNAEAALAELESQVKAHSPPKKPDAQLIGSVLRVLDLLKSSPFIGTNVQQKRWPRGFKGLPNLFRMELSQSWRLLYYVVGDETKIVCVVFEIRDDKYGELFDYPKK